MDPFNITNQLTETTVGNFDGAGNAQLAGNVSVGTLAPLGSGGVGVLELATAGTPPANITAGGIVAYAQNGVLKYVNSQGLVNTLTGSQGGITAAVTVANTAAETALQTVAVPASDPIAGAVYHSVAWGIFSWTGTPTIQFTGRWGGTAGTVLAQLPALTLGTAQTNTPFKIESWLNFLTATSVQAVLEIDLTTASASDVANPYICTPTAPVTVVTNVSKNWVLDVTWGTAAAGNTISMLAGFTERLS